MATPTDWLSQAAMSVADADGGHDSETKNVARRRKFLVTTRGWISMKLGLPDDKEHVLNEKYVDFKNGLFKRASQRTFGYGP